MTNSTVAASPGNGSGAHSTLCGDNLLAGAFARMHDDRLRFVAPWGHWMVWDGACWRRDDTLLALDLARDFCLRISGRMRQALIARQAERIGGHLDSAAGVAAIERFARTDRALAAGTEQWDTDLDLLNTPDGIVDTRSGALSPHRREAYMTRITSVGPAAPGTPCPEWWRFLDRITAGDTELQMFLQRLAGYALTGLTTEHALFFIHGTGANGKSTFINTLAGILGSYAEIAPMEAFARSESKHATSLARLASARLVTAQETEGERRWSEARIKALTGGDAVTARFLRRECFSFTPRFKLLFAGNQVPSLNHVDEAMRRRFRLIPFHVTIPEAERDLALMEKLRDEYKAILRWALDGAVSWRTMGLSPAARVRSASTGYLEGEDAFNLWRADCADLVPGAWQSVGDLYASWQAWSQRTGETAMSQKRFSQTVEARGFTRKRLRTGQRGFLGLKLRVSIAPAHRDVVETPFMAAVVGTSLGAA